MISGEIFKRKRIIVCCGSGGVGKTTISAAIALEAARRGRKAVVLTIDPAKRLATALGLDSLENEPREIPLKDAKGRLFAMMLDTKRTFDRLIEKYASSEEAKKSIFNNRLYQHMSNMIAGSQEYMAMERLYELYLEGGFDLLVLDTPPTRHALDFLEAPQKMVHITGNSLLKWLLAPGMFTGRIGLKALTVFDRLAGFSFLHELSEMLSLISGLLGGFHDRAKAVDDLLRKNFVGFFLVASPSSVSIQDALYFHQKIRESGLPFSGFVVNRVHPDGERPADRGLASFPSPLREKVATLLRNYEQLAARDQRAVTLLRKLGGRNVACSLIPLLKTDVHDLGGLGKINRSLFS